MVSTHGQLLPLPVIKPKGQGNFRKRDKLQCLKVIALRGGTDHALIQVGHAKSSCHQTHIVIFGELPSDEQQANLDAFLKAHGNLKDHELSLLGQLRAGLHPMRMLQGIIPLLDIGRGFLFEELDEEASHGLQIIARMPALIASFHHIQSATQIPRSNNRRSTIGNFLSMFTGKDVSSQHESILTVVQILQMEHSFNADTFTSRVVSSTLAPIDSVFSAAVGACCAKAQNMQVSIRRWRHSKLYSTSGCSRKVRKSGRISSSIRALCMRS